MPKNQDLTPPSQEPSVMSSAFFMSLGTLSSRVLGFLRDMVLAALFPRTVTDAFVVAFRLPNMFRRLLGEGALTVSFIPVYISERHQSPQRAKALSQSLFALLLSLTASLSALGVIFMEPLLKVLLTGKGYLSVAGKLELTIFLARIMFSYLFLVTTYAFLMSLLQAHKRFFLPAVAPAFFNLTFIIFSLFPSQWGRFPGEFLAWGVICGGLVQVFVVALPLIKAKLFPLPRFSKVSSLKTVLVNLIPGLIGMGILQIMSLVNVSFASRLPEGSHSYIYWGDRILELPQSLLAISMGAALLPTLSSLWAQNKKEEMREEGLKHMRLLLFFALPCAMGMWTLALPLVQVLFQRGNFTLEDAQKTASVVRIYSLLLLASSLHKVTVPSFYAIKNTWLPALTSAISLCLHIFVANIWVDQFGLSGLVGSTALATYFNMTLVLLAYHFFIGPLHFFQLLKSILHMLPATLLMGLGVFYFYPFMENTLAHFFLFPESLARLTALFTNIFLGAFIYFLLSYLLKQPDTQRAWTQIKKRLKPR